MPNNRELATLIWLGLIVILVVWHAKSRSTLRDLASSAAHPKILIPVVALLGYVGALVFAGWQVKWWSVNLTTDTVFWLVGSALVLLFNIERVSKTERFFRRTALGTVGATALTEFFVNDLFVFSLPVELVLLLVLAILTMVSVVAERQPQLQPAKRLVDAVLGLVGISLAVYIGFRLISEWRVIDKVDTLRVFALPVWLMLGVLPFIYVVSLYSNYELAFKWIDFQANAGTRRWRTKLALLLRLHGRTRDVGAFTMSWGREMASASSFREAWRVAGRFRASRREDR